MGSMKIYRLVGDGGPEGYGLLPSLDQLSLGKYLSMQIMDRTNATLIFSSDSVIFKNQKWEMKSRTLVEGIVEFSAMSYSTYSPGG
jgi:hypothetical protein